MKDLNNLFEKAKPFVEKDGKFHWLYSTYEAFYAFCFVSKNTSKSGTHIHDYIDLKRTMSIVVIALLPALLFGMYNVGYQHFGAAGLLGSTSFFETFWFGFLKVLPIIVVSYVVGLGIEFLFAQLRGHQVNEGFLVTGMLIPMIMPVNVPLWMVAVATAFSVVFVKEVFGGTGMNVWNPALVARAFLFFAYPAHMSGDSAWISVSGIEKIADGFTGATPLAQAVTAETANVPVPVDFWNSFTGLIPGSIGETSTIAILIGAVLLIVTGIASWKIMLSTVAGGIVMALTFNIFGGNNTYMTMPFWNQLVLGGFAFGTVFMATDPVSSAQTERGKWIYGFLIGILAILIRVVNPAFPEGMMMAILLMNTFAPLIDYIVVQGNIKRRMKRSKIIA